MRSALVRPLVASCVLSSSLLLAASAGAAGPPPMEATPAQKKQAMTHFTLGKRAIEAKNYPKALMELRASLDVVDSPNARLELARALRASGKLPDAYTEYRRVLADAARLAATEKRYEQTADAAKNESGELQSKLAFVEVTIAHAPADATLTVNGHKIPGQEWSDPVLVPAGTVEVVLADRQGKALARASVEASIGRKAPVTLDAQPEPAPAPPPPPAAPVADKSDDSPPATPPPATVAAPPPAPASADVGASTASSSSGLRPYAYVAGGIGVAGMAMFTVFGLMSNATYNDLNGACPPPNRQCPPAKQSEISTGRTQQTIANVSVVVGAVGLAAGATLFVLSLPHNQGDSASTAVVVGPAYVGVRGAL